MNIAHPIKRILFALGILGGLTAGFFIHALAGLTAQDIVFAQPPNFVEQYAAQFSPSTVSQSLSPIPTPLGTITQDIETERALVMSVFFADEPYETILQLFAHPDKVQRVKIASAFSAVNVEFTHDEQSGFAPKREIFWQEVTAHHDNIRNALFEALIVSAQEGTANHIPYTVAWMPGQGHETAKVLAWAAVHHPDWWIRRFSVFFVAEFGEDQQLAHSVLSNQTREPDYRVRLEILNQRFKQIMGS